MNVVQNLNNQRLQSATYRIYKMNYE